MRKLLLMIICCLLFPLVAQAESWDSSTESEPTPLEALQKNVFIHYGLMNGYTLYRIDFRGGASELEFPLDTSYWGVGIDLRQKDSPNDAKYRARFTATWSVNGDKKAGALKDRDWIDDDIAFHSIAYGSTITQNHPGVDIYSESDTDLRATVYDFHYYYNLYPKEIVSVGPMAGYMVRKFHYDVHNVNQVGYGPYEPFENFSWPGRVLEYDVRYSLIYAGLGIDFGDSEAAHFYADIGYSPWAKAKDRDDHILREKISEAATDGYAYVGQAAVDWKFSDRWSLAGQGQYTYIYTTGTQYQSFYGESDTGFIYTVDDTIKSKTLFWSLAIKYKF